MHAGLACLEALELLSITATNTVGDVEDISEEVQSKLDSVSDKFTAVYDSEEGE